MVESCREVDWGDGRLRASGVKWRMDLQEADESVSWRIAVYHSREHT